MIILVGAGLTRAQFVFSLRKELLKNTLHLNKQCRCFDFYKTPHRMHFLFSYNNFSSHFFKYMNIITLRKAQACDVLVWLLL